MMLIFKGITNKFADADKLRKNLIKTKLINLIKQVYLETFIFVERI